MIQLNIFQSEINRDAGIAVAVEHADAVIENWAKRTCEVTEMFLENKPTGFKFMVEDIRQFGEGKGLIETPPSLRAYCCVAHYLKRTGIAKFVYIGQVSNPKANRAFANVYEKI